MPARTSRPSGRTLSRIAQPARTARAGPSGREQAVASRVELAAAKTEFPADDCVVRVEELSPTTVAQLLRALRRADDVGEKQRHQHTVGTRSGPRSRKELLLPVDDLVRVDIRT
jgi:hypothetical protein